MRTAAALALLALVFAAPACQPRAKYQPVQADSTGAAVDSAALRVRDLQQQWEAGPVGAATTETAADVLAEALEGREPSDWKVRADAFLDSLGIGAETTDAPCALAVNFFSRSDPDAGAWPVLFWCGEKSVLHQSLEGQGLHLSRLAVRGIRSAPKDTVKSGVAVLFGRRAPGGQQPLLMTWSLAGLRWKLAQTLGPDSLGGVGSGDFEALADTAIDLVTRTYRAPRMFEECSTCPHVFSVHRFRWGKNGFRRVEDQTVPSPYQTFVDFVQALTAGASADGLVRDPEIVETAKQLGIDRPKGVWRIAPGSEETPHHMVFFRGAQEAYRVQFDSRGREWVIGGIESVPRSVE